jgi:hypothetical protein
MAAVTAKVAAAKVILKGVPPAASHTSKQALQEETPATAKQALQEAPAADAPAADAPAADAKQALQEATDSDAPAADDKPKIIGATGEEVFGKKDGAVAKFLGFQEGSEPNVLGMCPRTHTTCGVWNLMRHMRHDLNCSSE